MFDFQKRIMVFLSCSTVTLRRMKASRTEGCSSPFSWQSSSLERKTSEAMTLQREIQVPFLRISSMTQNEMVTGVILMVSDLTQVEKKDFSSRRTTRSSSSLSLFFSRILYISMIIFSSWVSRLSFLSLSSLQNCGKIFSMYLVTMKQQSTSSQKQSRKQTMQTSSQEQGMALRQAQTAMTVSLIFCSKRLLETFSVMRPVNCRREQFWLAQSQERMRAESLLNRMVLLFVSQIFSWNYVEMSRYQEPCLVELRFSFRSFLVHSSAKADFWPKVRRWRSTKAMRVCSSLAQRVQHLWVEKCPSGWQILILFWPHFSQMARRQRLH